MEKNLSTWASWFHRNSVSLLIWLAKVFYTLNSLYMHLSRIFGWQMFLSQLHFSLSRLNHNWSFQYSLKWKVMPWTQISKSTSPKLCRFSNWENMKTSTVIGLTFVTEVLQFLNPVFPPQAPSQINLNIENSTPIHLVMWDGDLDIPHTFVPCKTSPAGTTW